MIDLVVDLLEESRRRGFLGPGPVERHLDHARAFAVAWGREQGPERAIDLGAGGGLPGLVLAATAWPATRWTFLDAQRKRTDFLREAIDELGLEDRVEVITERAEVLGRADDHRATYELAVARSFGAPAVTAECGAPFLQVGGLLVVSEPPGDDQLRWPVDGLGMVGLGPAQPILAGSEVDPVHLVAIEQRSPCPDRYPRRVGQPSKRPLF